MIKIQEIDKNKQIDAFIRFAWQVYEKYPAWVPPLVEQTKAFLLGKSLFFQHCEHKLFVALKDDKIVATAAAFYDKDLTSHYKRKIGLIGYFEALPKQDKAVKELFKHAEKFLVDKGAKIIWAPFNGNIIFGLALSADAYDEYPLFLMPYNPPYYHSYFWKNGYKKLKETVAFTTDLMDDKVRRKISYVKRKARKSKVRIRPIDLKKFKEEIFRFGSIYGETFKKHWGYVPQSNEELYEMLEPFKMALEKDFVLFAEYKGKTIGFVLCAPDYNFILKNLDGNLNVLKLFAFLRLKKRIRKARLIAIGVSGGYRGQNIAPLLIANAYDAMIKKGYTTVEYSWVLAENIPSQKAIRKFHGKVYKHYAVYQKKLTI